MPLKHAIKYSTLVPAKTPLGESTFAAARKVIEEKHGVQPAEIFLDTVRVDGIVTAGDFDLDLGTLGLHYLVFGADYPETDAVFEPPRDVAGLLDEATITTSS